MCPRFRRPATIVSLVVFLFAIHPYRIIAQDLADGDGQPAATESMMSTRFIPPNAMILVDLRPSTLLRDDSAWMLPTEVITVWCEENLGIQIDNIQYARLVAPMFDNQGPPSGGVVVVFENDVSIDDLKPGLVDRDRILNVAGRDCFSVAAAQGEVAIHPATPRRWLIGPPDYLPTLMDAAEEPSPGSLSDIVAQTPQRGIAQIAIDLKPVRPLMMAAVMSQADEIPPAAGRLPELVNLIDAVTSTTTTNVSDWMTYGSWTMWANDDVAADQVEQIIAETADNLGSMAVAAAMQAIEGDDKISDALRAYVRRMERRIVPLVRLDREGRQFTLPTADIQGVAVAGVLAGALLPAVQASREAARRMNASNNLKQIGLAVHNYHSAFKRLPPRAIVDEQGEPLLSWRVAILPFMEQQALYEKFHLDEPWDSPHNRPLSELTPATYIDPSHTGLQGKTVFQSPDGPGTILDQVGVERRFRDVMDGLSNTLMVVEMDAEHAVAWSKPDDTMLPPNSPLDVTGDVHPGGFHVLMADGSVRFLTNDVDPNLLQAITTAAGSEIVNLP